MKLKFLKLNYIHNQGEKVWELKIILSFKKQFKINFQLILFNFNSF